MNKYKIELGSLYELKENNWHHIAKLPIGVKSLNEALDWYFNA